MFPWEIKQASYTQRNDLINQETSSTHTLIDAFPH